MTRLTFVRETVSRIFLFIALVAGITSLPSGVVHASATIALIKSATPADGTNFQFLSTIPGNNSFTLDDANPDDNDGISNSIAFLVNPGSYTVLESVFAGWALTSIDCVKSDPNAGLTVVNNVVFFQATEGETITCTFTNVKRGTITVVKNAVEKDGTDFTINLGGDATASAVVDDAFPDDNDGIGNSQTFSLLPGNYTLSEVIPAAWNQTSIQCVTDDAGEPVTVATNLVSIDLDAGENVTCTFNNAKQKASITITHSALPADGTNFQFLSTIPGNNLFTLDDANPDDNDGIGNSVAFLVIPGNYTVLESVLAGWALTSIDCVKSDPNAGLTVVNNVVFFVAGGNQSISCTFHNISTAPATVAMSSAAPNPTNASPIPVTVQFSKIVNGFDASDITPGNATVGNFVTVDGDTYTFTLTPSGQGAVTADIAAGSATDLAGIFNTAAAQFSRTYDSIPPDTTIGSNPSNPTVSTSASFGFTGSDGGSGVAGFECGLDGGVFGACSSPRNYAGLTDGSHTFQVRARDNAGNTDATPASFTWTVDATPPGTTIMGNPSNPTSNTGAGFSFTGNDGSGTGVASFQCNLDAGGFSTCISPKSYAVLSDGSHTFQVRAIDNAGNMDATPATFTWLVDATPPDTAITSNPPNPSFSTSASFGFTGSDGGSGVASFECNLDAGGFGACSSPKGYASLADGAHTFQVRARDNAGNTDATPASFTWTVDGIAPTLASFTRRSPATSPTNADTLVFRAAFGKDVQNVDAADFAVNGATTATVTLVTPVSASVYDVTVSGGDLASFNGTVGLNLGVAQNIADSLGFPLPAGEPAADETYTLDNIAPTAAIASAAPSPTNILPIPVTITFSEPVTGFAAGGIAVSNGTIHNFAGSGAAYTADITPVASGIVTLDVVAGAATDTAGNGNTGAARFSIIANLADPAIPALSDLGLSLLALLLAASGWAFLRRSSF